MRTMFIGTVIVTTVALAIGWKCWLTIIDRNTSQKKAALCGAWLAGLAVALVATAVSLPN
jgi:hypothetical protein